MRRLLLTMVVLLAAGEAGAAEPIGRLFFTPEQRAQMDVARAQRSRATLAAEIEQEAQPVPEILTYHGLVRRSDGKDTIWINDRAINDGKETGRLPPARPRPDGSIVLELPQSERKINLKVGQSVELLSGTIAEPYSRSVTAPKPAVKPPAQPDGANPAAAASASAAPQASNAALPASAGAVKPPAGKPSAQTAPPALVVPPVPLPPGVDQAAVEAQLESALEQMRRERAAGKGNEKPRP